MTDSTSTNEENTQQDSNQENSKKESYKVNGTELLERVKKLIEEGNARRITITDKNGKELLRFPLTVGVLGTAIAPVLAAVGAMAALITECTITVEKDA